MYKKITLNVVLLLATFFAPLYFLYSFQSDLIKMELIKIPMLLIMFLGAILLTYLNNKYRREILNNKWLWLVFMIIGVMGLCYSVFVLFLLFLFRNCCGF